ncbi:MAG: GSCFA domain-containing protein [Pseudomonadota bacterium]
MAGSDVHPVHVFQPWQIWPGSYDNPPAGEAYPLAPPPRLRLDRATPIASLGSCFAREIKTELLARGYNYIQEESGHPAAKHASAAWERMYNTFSMRQVFEYTFGDWSPTPRWWVAPRTGQVQDPYRRIILYDDLAQAEEDFARHRQCSRRALSRARVLILTLGLTEIWQDAAGQVICLPSGPYVSQGGDMSAYGFRVSRYQENLANLERIHALLAAHNPACELLVTVSPVHLWATFRPDLDVISASCNSKSTLRAVADEFAASHANVHYFPAYEMAAIYLPALLGRPILTEGRENFHVNQQCVTYIMDQFMRHYDPEAAGQGAAATL